METPAQKNQWSVTKPSKNFDTKTMVYCGRVEFLFDEPPARVCHDVGQLEHTRSSGIDLCHMTHTPKKPILPLRPNDLGVKSAMAIVTIDVRDYIDIADRPAF